MKQILLVLILFTATVAYAQVEAAKDSVVEKYIQIEGDSIIRSSIGLDEVYIFGKLNFSSYKEKVKYYILRRKTIKVYPYAKLASDRLLSLNDRLAEMKTKRQQKKYTKIVQKYIEEEFSAELKKLTRTEGQILVKLMHRQTGITTFNLVKQLRSGWKAFWYNSTARMFDISLKKEYKPSEVHEDYQIEDILQRAFAAGKLENQKTALDFDYALLSNKWETHVKPKATKQKD